jgi:hypothetical protein
MGSIPTDQPGIGPTLANRTFSGSHELAPPRMALTARAVGWVQPQVPPGQRQTGSDAVPQLVDVDVEQRSAVVVGCPLPSDVDSAFGHLITDPQGVEGVDRIAELVDPGAFAG